MILTRQEKEKLALELLSQHVPIRDIASQTNMSFRDIGAIKKKAEKEREAKEGQTRQRYLSSEAYKLFSQHKTPAQVAIALNLRQPDVAILYTEYLKLIQLDNLNRIYQEIKDDLEPFLALYRLTKYAGINVQQVKRLLSIANNYLPSAEHRYEVLQKQNNRLESILRTQAKEFQNLTTQISAMGRRLASIKLDCEKEEVRLDDLQQKSMKQEAIVKHLEDNNELYVKITKTVQENVEGILSDNKALLKLALLSLTESMRNDPEKFSSSIYFDTAAYYNRKQTYTDMLLEEAEKLYTNMVKELIDESISEHVFNTTTSVSSLSPTDK